MSPTNLCMAYGFAGHTFSRRTWVEWGGTARAMGEGQLESAMAAVGAVDRAIRCV